MSDAARARNSPPLTLAQRSLRGAAWNYSGTAVVVLGQLLYTALTARIISPTEFGAYATAQALMMLVGYFTLRTVGNAVIRHPSLDRDVIGTAMVITTAAGALVAVIVLAGAGLWADVWRSPGAASLLRLFAPQIVLGCLAIVPMSLLRRDLRYRSASVIETTSVVFGFVVGAALAWQLRNADALVLGQVANAAALAALGIFATRSRLHLTYSRSQARGLFSFSAQVSGQNLIHAVTGILPEFAVSRSLGQTSLGYFSRAELLVLLPQTFLAQGIYKTLYPIYPRFRDDKDERRRLLVDVTSVTTTLVWPLFAALAGLAPLVVDLLLGPRWTPVVSVIGPLCIFATMDFAYAIFTSFAESLGYLRQIWLVQSFWTITLVSCLGVAVLTNADMREIALVAAGVQVAVHLFQIALFARTGIADGAGTLRAEGWAALLAGLWYVATMLTTHLVVHQGMAERLVVSGLVLVALAGATWLALPHLPAGRAFSRRGIAVRWRPRGFRS